MNSNTLTIGGGAGRKWFRKPILETRVVSVYVKDTAILERMSGVSRMLYFTYSFALNKAFNPVRITTHLFNTALQRLSNDLGYSFRIHAPFSAPLCSKCTLSRFVSSAVDPY